MVDDAAAMAPERRAFAFPAQVVERAPLDAQELGSFSDCEEGVGIIGHEDLLIVDWSVSRISTQVWSDSGGTPADESYLSQEVAIPAP